MTPVNSIEIPEKWVILAGQYYDGMSDMLYAISSTGGLTTGSFCPNEEWREEYDTRTRKWYLSLWGTLDIDLGYAIKLADIADKNELILFQKWVENICNKLETEYCEGIK